MKPPLLQGCSNDFQTPPEALQPLYPFLKQNWIIWECATGKGNLGKELNFVEYNYKKDEKHQIGNKKNYTRKLF